MQAADPGDYGGVCVSTAGIVDYARGVVTEANEALMPGYTGTKIADHVLRAHGLPCHVENDVNCAAMAEYYLGAARGAKSCLALTVGTGIGGAFISDGKLLHGHTNSACEVGYILMGERSFEEEYATSVLVERCGAADGREVFARAKSGDALCRREIERMCDGLARGIAMLCYVLNPEIVVIGGGISAQSALLQPLIRAGMDRYLIAAVAENTKLAFAACGNRAGMLGSYYAMRAMRAQQETANNA